MAARRPTMKDVASTAGVSLSTVSRVVNGSPPVAPELAAKVERAIELLGYRHNHTAGTLRRSNGRSGTIGLIFDDVSNPFFSAIQRGVEDVARTRSVFTFAGSSDADADAERQLAEALLARRVDGLIIVPTGDQTHLLREVAAGLSIVFVDRPPGSIDADSVISDNRGGADRAVTHLIAHGHRRIGFLGDRPTLHTSSERLAGYCDALERAGIPRDPELILHPGYRADGAYAMATGLIAHPDAPTALFTGQNLITIEALRALHHAGLQHTVALAGFDDVELGDAAEPGLTVVVQDAQGLGRAAAELLFARVDGFSGPARQVVLDTPLVVRGSGELPPRR